MDTAIAMIASQYELQTRLYRNVLRGIETGWEDRINDQVNHFAWIAGHLVSSRYMLAKVLGLDVNEPYPEFFENGKGIAAGKYPVLKKQLKAWEEISPQLTKALRGMSAADLEREAPFQLPTGKQFKSLVVFFAHHEAYHIGQMGLLRKYFKNEAMSYA